MQCIIYEMISLPLTQAVPRCPPGGRRGCRLLSFTKKSRTFYASVLASSYLAKRTRRGCRSHSVPSADDIQ